MTLYLSKAANDFLSELKAKDIYNKTIEALSYIENLVNLDVLNSENKLRTLPSTPPTILLEYRVNSNIRIILSTSSDDTSVAMVSKIFLLGTCVVAAECIKEKIVTAHTTFGIEKDTQGNEFQKMYCTSCGSETIIPINKK